MSLGIRKHFLDLLRIIACFLVIVNHTNSAVFDSTNPEDLTWFLSVAYFFICKIAVPIFFMISGYLLLNKSDTWAKTFSRIFRMVITLVVCSAVYAAYRNFQSIIKLSFSAAIEDFSRVYYNSPSNALWYLYAYIGILFMLPFLQKMAQAMTKKDYHIFFAISGFFTSFLPILMHYFPIIKINSDFSLPVFSGYICMLLVGQYFSRFGIKRTKRGFCVATILFVLTVAFNVVATYFEYKKSSSYFMFFDNRVFLPILLASVCVFYMATFIEFPEKIAKIISYIGSCTFGIYLISDISISSLKPIYTNLSLIMNPLIAVLIFEICVFVVGFIITAILKKLPLVKKIL